MTPKITLPLMSLIVVGLIATASQAQKKSSKENSLVIAYTEYDLPNGLHVILHEDHTMPIVAVNVGYHVGSKNEETSRTGFAHFFEHLMFEGSDNIKRGEFFKYVESSGGQNNAYTTQDKTNYYEVFPVNKLALGLWLESERMLHAKIDEAGVETQRGVVKEERRQRYDNQPYGSFFEKMFQKMFPESSYHWTPIGSMEHLNSASIEEFRGFYKKFYVPNNACLSIAGDIDVAETKKLVQMYFGDIPRGGEIIRPAISEPKQTAQKRETVEDNIQLPAVFAGFVAPEAGSKDSYALSVLAEILSTGESSRLYQRLVNRDQLAVASQSFNYSLEKAGLFILFNVANFGKNPDDVEKAMMEEIGKVQKDLVTENEFEKARNSVEVGFINSRKRIQGKADALAENYLFFGNTNLINKELDEYRAVTREEVRRVAQKYLTKENSTVLTYVPKKKA